MIIGILTHHFASNFGANIQTLSTVGFLKNNGHTPIVINWRDASMEEDFVSSVSMEQNVAHEDFLDKYLPISEECRTSQEIANVIKNNKIEAVIIGSDAVVQHHPFFTRLAFPTRSFISLRKYTKDRLFPNFFWGNFSRFLESDIPLAFMSVSCQNSPYNMFARSTIMEMNRCCKRFNYISVRDSWTKKMFIHINKKYKDIPITPDPVFAFNQNASEYIPNKETILHKYGLEEKYLLLSFFGNSDVNTDWIRDLANEATKRGYQPIILPFPSGACHINGVKEIDLPLSPIDWYAIIKYSSGFVGRNMHPIVVSLHNSVPFFSLDQYGTRIFNVFVNQRSSKIYDILERAKFSKQRITHAGISKSLPLPTAVLDSLLNFDIDSCNQFSHNQTSAYNKMMNDIILSFSNR